MNKNIEYNQEHADMLFKEYGYDNLKEVYDNIEWGKLHSLFKCTSCGKFITGLTMKFYDYDYKKVKCYSCQRNNK